MVFRNNLPLIYGVNSASSTLYHPVSIILDPTLCINVQGSQDMVFSHYALSQIIDRDYQSWAGWWSVIIVTLDNRSSTIITDTMTIRVGIIKSQAEINIQLSPARITTYKQCKDNHDLLNWYHRILSTVITKLHPNKIKLKPTITMALDKT